MNDEPWRQLAKEMSDISELAYCAGWMLGLEFALWRAVQGGGKDYGMIVLDDGRLARLRTLSAQCGGWVQISEDGFERFVPADEWERRYATWLETDVVPEPD